MENLVRCLQILLSFEVLGNPVGSISTLGTGLRDFFVEPAQGMGKGVRMFGEGLGTLVDLLIGRQCCLHSTLLFLCACCYLVDVCPRFGIICDRDPLANLRGLAQYPRV